MNLYSRYSLYVVLGIILKSVCLNSAGTFRRPVSGADARISELQNQLLAVQADIVKLNAAASAGDNTEDLKNRLSALENQFQSLTEKLNDERRQNAEMGGKYDREIADLTRQRDVVQDELSSLKHTLNTVLQTFVQIGMSAIPGPGLGLAIGGFDWVKKINIF